MIQDIILELETASFRIAGVVGGVVVGDRPVAGERHVFRICSAWPERSGWHARMVVTRPNPKRATARLEEVVCLGGPFAEVLAFATWLAGAVSLPVSEAEVAALTNKPAQAVVL